MKRKHYIALSIISLALGVLVYILFNSTPCAFDIIPWIRLIPEIRIHSPIINQFIQCYCADLFWAMSFAFIVQGIVMLSQRQAIGLLLTAFLGIAVEIFQLLHIMKGVFDPIDILVYLLGAFVVVTTVILGGENNENNN